jgi:hypothetical protein
MCRPLSNFSSFLDAVKDDDFEERPVNLDTFLYSDEFMNLPPLSEYQITLLESMTQVYRQDTLIKLWGVEEGERLWRSTHQETISQLGKGSGKDMVTSIAFARIAYLLLCLKDPAKYYGKPPGDSIAMLNVAINAKQAKNVFFRYLKSRISLCSWFDGRWDATQDSITFDKNIEAHSGHSEREAWEGYNFIIVVLDEIAGFATEAQTTSEGGSRDKTADAIYDMYKASVSSRFPKYGKLVLLSFPRYKGDYIQKRYNEAVAEKNTIIREHKFKIHEDMVDGVADNEFSIEWEEDHIISYTEPGVYALKRPTWDVNPTMGIDDLKPDFLRNREDALSRFACMPPESVDAFFKDRAKIESAFNDSVRSPFNDDWSWRPDFKPDKERNYYLHVDLAYKHDRAAVAMASVSHWVTVDYGSGVRMAQPVVSVDAVRYWTPTASQNVDLEEVQNFVVTLKRSGFPIKLVTFDGWNCLPAYTWVYTDKGMQQVGDLGGYRDGIATHAGTGKVSDFRDNGLRETYQVTTRFGYTIDGTDNHPVLTDRGWVNIGDLKEGDRAVLRSADKWSDTDQCTVEEARALGVLVAEGWREKTPGRYEFKLTMKDKDVIDTLYRDLLSIKPDLHRTESLRYEEDLKWSTCHYNAYSSKEVHGRLVELGWIGGSFTEEVPGAVMRSGKAVQVAFLSGLFEGDGHINLSDSLGVYYETRSYRLAHQVRLILLNMGILCSWHESWHAGSMRYRLCIRGARGMSLLDSIPMISERKRSSVDQYRILFNQRFGRKLRWDFDEQGNVELDIVSVKPIGVQRVYDITVPGDHSFIADGVVTHNSAGYRQRLRTDFGIETDLLSVAKPHYEDFSLAMGDGRVKGYSLPLLVDELLGLRIIKGNRVDHPRTGSKDLSDSVAGAVYNVVANERSPGVPEIEIYVGAPSDERNRATVEPELPQRATTPMPPDLAEWLDRFQIL